MRKVWFLILPLAFTVTLAFTVIFNFSSIVSSEVVGRPVVRWAVLLGGTMDALPEPHQALRDTYYMYHYLVYDLGIDPERIMYLYPSVVPPPWLEDYVVDMQATKQNFRWVINTWLKSNVKEDDVVLIYIMTHGVGYNAVYDFLDGARIDESGDEGSEHYNGTWFGVDEALVLEVGEERELLWDDEFKEDLDTLRFGDLILIIHAGIGNLTSCYSGGFIDDLSATKRTIVTSTNETWYSAGDWDNDGFSEFSSVFIDALHGYDCEWDYSNRKQPIKHGQSVNADFDGNGHVSITEAFNYALKNDVAVLEGCESPWLDDDGDGLPTYVNGADNLDSQQSSATYIDWLIGDVNSDGKIDGYDLTCIGFTWLLTKEQTGFDGACDFNTDNRVDAMDLTEIGFNWLKQLI